MKQGRPSLSLIRNVQHEIRNEKRQSMKDFKCIFYQYSLLDNHQLKIVTNVQIIMVSNKNDGTPGGHSGPRHTHKTKSSPQNI